MFISNFILLLLLVDIALSFFFGFIVLITKEGWKKAISRRFFAFTVSAVLWQTMNLVMFYNMHSPQDLFWTRSTYLTGIIGAYFLFRFVIVFPEVHLRDRLVKIIDFGGLTITLAASVISILPDTITSVSYTLGSRSPQYGASFLPFACALVILCLLIFFFAAFNYFKSGRQARLQVRYMLIGIGVTLALIIFSDVISPSFVGSNYFSNFDAFSLIFLFGLTAYSIVKYELFEIRVILTEAAAFVIAFAVLVQTFMSGDTTQTIVNAIIFVLVLLGSYLLVKSVIREIKQKEEMERLSDKLGAANLKLKQVDAMKTEFISMASHELLTPISAIEGYLSMMLDEKMVRIDDPKARRYMDSVYQSSRRLARLVTDLLNVSRLEQGRLLVQKAPVDLNEIIKQVMMELQIKAKENKQILAYQPGDGVDAKSYGDADKIKEVVVNMAGNSLKYTKPGGEITVSTSIWPTEKVVAAWEHLAEHAKNDNRPTDGVLQGIVHEKYRELVGDKQLVITIKDNGVGISPSNLGQLFQKFSRIGDWSTQRVQGTGLGLYISRALVEIHHGRVWADSEGEGKGSAFYFSLPLAAHTEEIKALDKEVPQAADAKPLARPAKMEAERLSKDKSPAPPASEKPSGKPASVLANKQGTISEEGQPKKVKQS